MIASFSGSLKEASELNHLNEVLTKIRMARYEALHGKRGRMQLCGY